jgi:hypothetical protein
MINGTISPTKMLGRHPREATARRVAGNNISGRNTPLGRITGLALPVLSQEMPINLAVGYTETSLHLTLADELETRLDHT